MKQKRFILAFILILAVCLAGCGKSEISQSSKNEETVTTKIETPKNIQNSGKKKHTDVLVAYFTGTGNTEKIAKSLADITGAQLYKIEAETPYTSEDLNYNDDSCRANKEMQDSSARPKMKGSIEKMEDYQVIYLGYPIWWGTAPRIINTFIESYGDALKGKTIVTFCTSGGSEITKSNEELKSAYPEITWIPGHRFKTDASQSTIEDWINTLNLK
ncbi:MAG: flavodoxin [bacterium]|nr:flavodoxin [bacterium]